MQIDIQAISNQMQFVSQAVKVIQQQKMEQNFYLYTPPTVPGDALATFAAPLQQSASLEAAPQVPKAGNG